MNTTAPTPNTQPLRDLMVCIGPEELENLSGPVTAEQEVLIAAFLNSHPVELPLRDLVDSALNLDGSTRDETAYARLIAMTR